MSVKEWRILLLLEYEWRVVKMIRRLINWLVRGGMKLSSRTLCIASRSLDHQLVNLASNQQLYEDLSGQVIMFYKRDEI